MTIHTFGAIDVGSYEQELKIFEVSKARGIRPVDSLVRRVDLGSDTYQTGKIRSGNVREVGDILREFREVMNNYRVTEYKAYGTSAIREMDNASMVLSLWEQRSGIHVGVLSNSEQRFLDYKSAAAKIGDFDSIISDSCAIVDIGGGSIQISLFSDGKLGATQNLRLGILRLYEKIRSIDARESQRDAMISEMVDSQLEVFQKLYLNNRKIRNLIIVDDYISALMQSRKMEDVPAAAFIEYVRMARDMSVPEIARRVQIADDNVPLLYISGVLMERIIEAFGTEHIWAPGITLCDGIAYEFAEKQKILPPSHNFEEDIIACAHNISRRYMGDETRGETIETIALRIFDALRKQYGLSKRERLLLRICAILHDCGKYISITNLAECSYNIIMSTEIIGLSHIEREIVANVVRFNHSEFVYYEEQQNMSDLDLDAYLMIGRLTAILRLANGMDRSHKRKFEDFGLTLKPDRLQINIRPGVDITLEKGMFAHRADFFEEIFGIRPVIRQKK